MSSDLLFRVKFKDGEDIHFIYARYISEESLVGFVELDEIVFYDDSSLTLIEGSQERLKQKLSGVQRTYLPLQVIMRIDEMEVEPRLKLKDSSKAANNIRSFPKDSKK
jgi:hypothetical protein